MINVNTKSALVEKKVEDITLFSINTDGTYSEPIKFDNLTSVTLDGPSINNNYITRHIPTSFTATKLTDAEVREIYQATWDGKFEFEQSARAFLEKT